MRARGGTRGLLVTVLAALLAGAAGGHGTEGGVGESESSELALSLRRALMANNYDYSSGEHSAPPAPPPHTPPPPAHSAELAPRINEVYIPRAPAPGPSSAQAARAPSKHDLLYYVDDSLLTRRRAARRNMPPPHGETPPPGPDPAGQLTVDALPASAVAADAIRTDGVAADAIPTDGVREEPPADEPAEESPETTPKVKYKMLKVRSGVRSRRSGRAVFRRLLQEEGAAGVALINLQDGPFPPFRLPSPRRRRDSDELPPPPHLDQDEGTVTRETPLTTAGSSAAEQPV